MAGWGGRTRRRDGEGRRGPTVPRVRRGAGRGEALTGNVVLAPDILLGDQLRQIVQTNNANDSSR